MRAGSHPPPPWRLRGEAAIFAAPVRADAARRFAPPTGARILAAGGWTLGGALLARYDETATLAYHELIVFSALARAGGAPPAFVVSHIYVDSEASLSGGHAIWGLPKELAAFDWSPRAVAVRREDGVPLLRARWRARAGRVPVPLYAPVLGGRDGVTVRAAGFGRLAAAPALAALEVPVESPFAALALGGTRAGIAGGGLDLRFPDARPV
ncbi:MAG TPA: acetoacetate decarboxylase family protein [Solirubrobacteraceae bacterium]|jgi:hypothetical protein